MPESRDEQRVIRAERRALQALCQGTPEGSVLEAGRRILRDYRWREPLHEMVFQALMTIPSGAPSLVRDLLPSRLTRKGFPDLAWEAFFQPHSLTRTEAERLMEQLRDSGTQPDVSA
jgi:hypothetical protein